MPGMKKQCVDRSSDDETTDEENPPKTPTNRTGVIFQDKASGSYERVTYSGVPHGAGVLLDDHPNHNLESHQPMTDPNSGRTFYSGTYENMNRGINAWRRGTAEYVQAWYDTSPLSFDIFGCATGGLRCDLIPDCKGKRKDQRECVFMTLRARQSHWKAKHPHLEKEDTDGKKGATEWIPDYGDNVQFPAAPHHWPADPPVTNTMQRANVGETSEISRNEDKEQEKMESVPTVENPDQRN